MATDNGFTISEIESDGDHVHLLIDCNPQHSIPNIIKALKGVSARLLFKEFPQLKKKLWGGNIWNPSYFVATVREHMEAQLRQYIQNQKVR
ncbi:transposase, putative [Anoxybacillus amylolyticus]|uniref:Transposase, putative n=1 Tax=Anoxybacteroides amylolyticum TaxID=294699 RepID=A0A160F0W0_9BACL|nr:transposase, putative [Anoxybacillus amylolyticus]